MSLPGAYQELMRNGRGVESKKIKQSFSTDTVHFESSPFESNLFYSIILCSILFRSNSFYSIRFYSNVCSSILFYSILL